jgi:sulfite reductase beta subunit-like hemoprotein
VSQAQYEQTVAAQERFEYEQARLEARANELLAAARDDTFREELEEKYPILKGWTK